MNAKVPSKKSVSIKFIRLELAVRYDEEDIPNDFPMRHNDMWQATVNIDTGEIIGWPQGKSGKLDMKVCDEGIYTLLDDRNKPLAKLDGYVPHGVVPGEYGDYVRIDINDKGIITNWPKSPDVSKFFGGEDDAD